MDLQRDTPEDFEGRIVVWNDCKYVVGPYVGSGATKFVYELINQQSGLRFHVIKIWRSLEQAKAQAGKLDMRSLADLEVVATTYEVFAHGGAFDIQPYFGPYEDAGSPQRALMAEADKSVKANDPARAVELYDRVLASNEYHTAALNNRAWALQQMGKVTSAFNSIWLAVRVEPNHPPYYRSLLTLGIHIGYLRASQVQFGEWKRRLYLTGKDYSLGIQTYLASGEPSKARELLTEGKKFCKRMDFSADEQAIDDALEKKKKAEELIAEGGRSGNTSLERDKAMAGVLRKAIQLYPYDVRSHANLAFTLFRMGAAEEARDVVLSLIHVVPVKLVPVCMVHAAFCEIKSSNAREALTILKDAMDILLSHVTDGSPIDPWAAPRPGIWIGNDWKVLQESPESALEIIDNVLHEAESARLEVPIEVRDYRELLWQASRS